MGTGGNPKTGEMIRFDEYFSDGWFNHSLENIGAFVGFFYGNPVKKRISSPATLVDFWFHQ